jgi:hypothetical protein
MISKGIGCLGVMTTLCHAQAKQTTSTGAVLFFLIVGCFVFCVNEILLYFSLLLGSPIFIQHAAAAFHGKIEKSQHRSNFHEKQKQPLSFV